MLYKDSKLKPLTRITESVKLIFYKIKLNRKRHFKAAMVIMNSDVLSQTTKHPSHWIIYHSYFF